MTADQTKPLVLVTGATGYIAGHCIRELMEHGYRVRGTVRSLADTSKTDEGSRKEPVGPWPEKKSKAKA